ncbi:ABC-type oligopeptide transporter ABCB9-like [Sycon ciliatum]|uniref:ABC-type oligopeptide transporter ABCB9-like n=1 Tax=Sycon ciliatum TaxID=27933 RepID=UPI0031F5F54F
MELLSRQSLILLAFSAIDILVETLLTLKIGADFDRTNGLENVGAFSYGAFRISQYHFAISPLDVWITAVLRCAICIGVTVGVLHAARRARLSSSNPASFRKLRTELVVRVRRLQTPGLLTGVSLFVYLVAKFLFSIEFNSDGTAARNPTASPPTTVATMSTTGPVAATTPVASVTSDVHIHVIVRVHPWLWALLAWSLTACIVQLVYVHRVGDKKHSKVRPEPSDARSRGNNTLLVNESAVEEDVPLLHHCAAESSEAATADSEDDEQLLGKTAVGSSDSNDSDSSGSDDSDNDSDSADSDSDSGSDSGERRRGDKKKKRTTKQDKDLNKPSTWMTVKKLLKQSMPDWMFILGGFFFLIVATIAQSLMPLYIGKVINSIAIDRDADQFHRAIMIMAVLSAVGALGAGVRGGLFSLVCARLNIRLRNKLFGSVVRQDMAFFDTTRTGDITSRLTSDTEKMSDLIGMNINVFSRSIAKACGVLVFMFKLSWKLTIVTMVSLPVVSVLSYMYGEYYKKLSEKVQSSLAKANDVAEEVCSSIKTVRSFAWEAEEADNYSEKLKRTYKLQVKEALAYCGYNSCSQLLEWASVIAILFYGGYLVLNDELSGGYLVSFILYCEELGSCIEDVGDVFTGLMSAAGAAEKVFKWIERKPDTLLEPDKPDCGELRGEVEFKQVSFRYPSRPESTVLKDVSFVARPGEVVALVGPSGSGKSSCMSLLERFYQPDSGTILLDGQPLNMFNHKSVHERVVIVSQEPVLFARSLRDNIRYALPGASDDCVEEAAKLSNAHGFVSTLPRGYSTQAGERGQQLSGGQKQRIAIARGLARQPTVLLLDEATSALDAESEHILQQSLLQAMSDRTIIVVAHRLSTVEHADRIVVIADGCVTEQGTHTELLNADGMYAQLVQRQLRHSSSPSQDDDDSRPSPSAVVPRDIDRQVSSRSTGSAQRQRSRRGNKSGSFSSSGDSSAEDTVKKRR